MARGERKRRWFRTTPNQVTLRFNGESFILEEGDVFRPELTFDLREGTDHMGAKVRGTVTANVTIERIH